MAWMEEFFEKVEENQNYRLIITTGKKEVTSYWLLLKLELLRQDASSHGRDYLAPNFLSLVSKIKWPPESGVWSDRQGARVYQNSDQQATMKRQAITRRLKTNPKNRKSPLIVAAISENRESNDQNDMSKAKRVKFTLPEPTLPSRTDAPKTSEYAFFKKLKEDIGGYYSRPLHKDHNDQLKTAKASDRSTGISTPSIIFKNADGNMRSSLQSERERPTGSISFLSPPMHAEANDVYELNSRGNQYDGTGIFSVKRQKLRQLVADTFPVVGECSSKGFDLVSALLSRLFPNGNKNECQYSNSKEGVLDTTYLLAAGPRSDAEKKTLTTEYKYTSSWNDDFPEYWSCSPRETVLSMRDVTTSNVPLIEYHAETDFQDEEAKLNRGFDGTAVKYMFRARDSSCYLSSDKYESVSSGHLKELDGFRNSNEPARREPCNLLLCWDVDEEKEQNFCSALVTSSDVAYRQLLADSFHAIDMNNTPFLCSSHTLDFNSLPYAHSTGSCWHDLGTNHEDDYAVVATNQFRSFSPQYFTMAEDCDTCDLLEKNNVSLHCEDHSWFTSMESGRKDHFEALLFSGGLNGDSGWKHLPLSEFSGEHYSSNSHIFHFPFKEDISSFALQERSLYHPKHRETTVTFSEGGCI